MKNNTLTILGLFIGALILVFGCGKPEDNGNPDNGGETTIEVSSVNLNTSTLELEIGEESQLTAIVYPSDASDKVVIWGTSNAKIVSVSETGLVKGLAEGSATITATAGGKQNTCAVSVSKATIKVESISLDRTSLEIEVDGSYTLIATVLPDNATDKTVTWTSDNPTIAKVSDTGTVTGLAEGKTTILAKSDNLEASCEVNVVPKVVHVTSVVLSETEVKLYPNEICTLTVEVMPENAIYETIEWSSSSPEVATVIDGVITSISLGTTIIAAKVDGVSATCNVSVIERPQPLAFQEYQRAITKSSAGYSWTPCVQFFIGRGVKLQDEAYEHVVFGRSFEVNLLDNQPSTDYVPLIYWPTYEGSGIQQTIYYNFLAHSKVEDGIIFNDFGKENCLFSYKVNLTKGFYSKAFKMTPIIADKEKSNTPGNTIYLPFNRPMCQLVFSANAGSGVTDINAKIVVKKISITNIKTAANLKVRYLYGETKLSWEDFQNEKEVVVFEGEKEITSSSYVELTSDDDENTISIIPQSIPSEATLDVTYDIIVNGNTISNVYSQYLSNSYINAFDSQRRYDLFLTVNASNVSVSASVRNWDNEDTSTITID